MKSKIITIAGLVGSGKTSTSNGVAKEFGYRRFSAGDFQRATAESLGLPYDEYQKLAEQDPQYDRKADTALENAGKDSEIVIDARLGYYFVPNSYKVFLYLSPEIAAQRILKDAEANPAREKENQQRITSPEEMVKSINDRYESERLRYNKYYNITDYHDPKDFDLYIDTSIHPLVKVIQMIVEGYKEWLAS
jgi:cytidylate kinase